MTENDNINVENDENTNIEDNNVNELPDVDRVDKEDESNIEGDENTEEDNDSVKKPNNKKRFAIFAALGLALAIGVAGAYHAYDYAQDCSENTEEDNDSVKKPNNKKRFAIFAALGLALAIGVAGAYHAYDYAQDCSLHNQQVEKIYDDSLNVAKAVDVDQSTLTYEARLNTINDANEAKSNLKNEIKKDKYKYADGTSPDWDAVVACYDNVIKKSKEAQVADWTAKVQEHVNFDVDSSSNVEELEQHVNSLNALNANVIKKSKEAQVADWTAKVQEHVNFDVDSSSNVEELEQHVNSLNALNAEIASDDAREYILKDYKDDKTTLENTIQEQVARYQARIEAVKQEQKKAEEERQAAAAAAKKDYKDDKTTLENTIQEQVARYQARIEAVKQEQKKAEEERQAAAAAAKKNKSNNYSSGGSSSSSSSNGGGSSSSSGSSSGGKVVISWMDFYDENGNFIERVYKYSDGTYSDPYAFF